MMHTALRNVVTPIASHSLLRGEAVAAATAYEALAQQPIETLGGVQNSLRRNNTAITRVSRSQTTKRGALQCSQSFRRKPAGSERDAHAQNSAPSPRQGFSRIDGIICSHINNEAAPRMQQKRQMPFERALQRLRPRLEQSLRCFQDVT
jgi:hypothetical protein